MDRRKALKNLGLGLGYTIATPTLFSLIQSCKETNVATWTPEFYSKEQGQALTHLVDILLPKTDTPSASELKVDIFLDKFSNEVIPEPQQAFSKMTFDVFLAQALADSGKETTAELDAADLEITLGTALKISKETEKSNGEALETYMEAMLAGESANLDKKIAVQTFAGNLRNSTIWAFKNTEQIGKEVLAYLPVPGEYIGCGDLQDLTGGKAWTF